MGDLLTTGSVLAAFLRVPGPVLPRRGGNNRRLRLLPLTVGWFRQSRKDATGVRATLSASGAVERPYAPVTRAE
jgi:hypothetical protein